MQTAVANLINNLHDQPAWWYGIHYDATTPNSLCNLLGIKSEDYHSFLTTMRLVDSRGFIKRGNSERLAGDLVGIDWQWVKADGKKQIFICIGQHPNKKKDYPKKAEEQIELHSIKKVYPPKRSSDIEAKEEFLKVWREHQTYQQDVEKKINNGKSPAAKKSNVPTVVTPSSAKTTQLEVQNRLDKEKILNILGRELLSKLFDGQALNDVVRIFKSSLTVDEVLDYVANTHNQVLQERDIMMERKKNALEHATQPKRFNVLPSQYPYMTSRSIDVTNSEKIGRLLREVSKLQKEIVSKDGAKTDIFKFKQHNDVPTTLVRVPTNRTRKHFEKNLSCYSCKSRGGYNFVMRVLDAMLPDAGPSVDEEDDDEPVDHDRTTMKWSRRHDAAEGMIVYLGKHFGAAFIRASEILGMPVVKKNERMDVATSAAMCDDAGLSNSQKRIINKYTIHHLGHPLTATESNVRALANNVIPPVAGECEVEKERCPFWKKDPVEVFQKRIKEMTECKPTTEWDNLDIVMGGDHGQGVFCLPAKLLLKKKEVIKFECEMNLGEVECKKDTSEILRASILPYINEQIKKIVKYERDSTNKIKTDGTVYEFRTIIDGGSDITRFSFKSDAAEGEELVRERPLRFVVTGDLAFYAVILGMKNASPFHCHLCLLRKTDWEKRPREKGEQRTIQWIQNNWHKARQGKGGRVCGVIERPLLDAIDPSRFVVPPLHSMLGVANSILNDFKVFIDLLLEDAPPRLKILRNNELKADKLLLDKGEEIREWGTLNGPALASCHEEKEELMMLLDSMLVAGEGTDEDRSAINKEIEEVNDRLAALNAEREKLVVEETLLSTEWKKKKAKLSAFLKKKGSKKYIKPVKARFEACLRRFGVDYAAYHGGDLVGNDCRILMGRAEEIFAALEGVLMAVAREKRMSTATKEAITSRCQAIRDALVVFDSIFSIVNKPNSKVDMNVDLPRLKMLLEKGLIAWQNLKDKNERGDKNITPKVHGLMQHLADQFELLGGLGDFDEQFIERHHQTGKRDRVRGRNMRDCGKKYYSFSLWETIRKHRNVRAKKMVVNESRKRNFKGERKDTAKVLASKSRSTIRDRIIANIDARDLSGESARILGMNELKEYNPLEEDIDYEGEGGGGTMDDDEDEDVDGMDVIGAEDI